MITGFVIDPTSLDHKRDCWEKKITRFYSLDHSCQYRVSLGGLDYLGSFIDFLIYVKGFNYLCWVDLIAKAFN